MMPTSVRGAFDPRRNAGFTLIEILVVLLLIGILAAGIATRIGPDDRQVARAEAEKLADLLESAAEDAASEDRTLGWSGRDGSYAFWVRGPDGSWNPLDGEDFYRRHDLGDGISISSLSIDGVAQPPGKTLVFNPSGVNRPFSISLLVNGASVRISGDALNRVRLDATS